MRYEEFRERLLSAISVQAGEEVTYHTKFTKKNNGVCREYLFVRKKDSQISPAVGLEDLYESAGTGYIDFFDLARQIIDCCRVENEALLDNMDMYMDFPRAREHIYVRLINKELNKDLLKDLPHEDILDLALICHYHMKNEAIGEGTVLIDKNQLERWGICKEQLFAIARANTVKEHPASLMNMNDMLRMLENECRQEMGGIFPDLWSPLYVLTNDCKTYGAYVLFYPNLQQHVADVFNSSYFILPSSIHETILLPDDGQYSPETLKEMVMDVNRTQMDPREVLSDIVYYYDREKNEMKMLDESVNI